MTEPKVTLSGGVSTNGLALNSTAAPKVTLSGGISTSAAAQSTQRIFGGVENFPPDLAPGGICISCFLSHFLASGVKAFGSSFAQALIVAGMVALLPEELAVAGVLLTAAGAIALGWQIGSAINSAMDLNSRSPTMSGAEQSAAWGDLTGGLVGSVAGGVTGGRVAGAAIEGAQTRGLSEESMPASSSLSNEAARRWYLDELAKIDTEAGPELTSSELRAKALRAFEMRNAIKLQTRELMADRAMADSLPRPRTLPDVIRSAVESGERGDDVWRHVLRGSQRSNASVNEALGIEK